MAIVDRRTALAGAMTVRLRNIGGDVLWQETLEPQPVGVRPQV